MVRREDRTKTTVLMRALRRYAEGLDVTVDEPVRVEPRGVKREVSAAAEAGPTTGLDIVPLPDAPPEEKAKVEPPGVDGSVIVDLVIDAMGGKEKAKAPVVRKAGLVDASGKKMCDDGKCRMKIPHGAH